MNSKVLEDLLDKVREGSIEVKEAVNRLKCMPFEDTGFASIDHHRELRRGFPEVIYGEGKRAEDIVRIMENMIKNEENVLVTRLGPEKAKLIGKRFPSGNYHARSGALTVSVRPLNKKGKGKILVVSAGTADVPVAEEAAITAEFMGNEVSTIFDIGVAGLHRVFGNHDKILEASVVIVVAGMEGALPSVIGGLVDKPVIAVPTSAGYGASFGGLSALLGMLNSCASGVTVVNIDNGFGAGYAASLINHL